MNTKVERYNYTDVTLYKRNVKGLYLNLTDFELEGDNQKICIEEQSNYIIAIDNYESKSELSYICVTLEDIRKIIGIADIKRESTSSRILQRAKYADLIYAKEILDTGRHKRIIVENGKVYFQTRKCVPAENGRQHQEWCICAEFKLKKKDLIDDADKRRRS